MKYTRLSWVIWSMVLLFAVTLGSPAVAQKKKKKGDTEEATTPTPPSKKKPKGEVKDLDEVIKSCKAHEGLFTIYQDTTSGSAYILIEASKIGKEFIYFRHILDGSLFGGHFRGAYMGSDIVRIEKYFNRIELLKENTDFYFDPNNALSRASGANISKAVMFSEDVYAQNEQEDKFLLKADGLFLAETLQQIKQTSKNPKAFSLGRLSKEKSKYLGIRNYEANTDVAVEYVYDNATPNSGGGPGITDARYMSVQVQHSFIEVPDNNFEPRFDDARIGYFMQQKNDMTATDATPYRDIINRWHLEKADPDKSVSDVKEPITWWIENTTPVEFRETIKQGVLAWNRAFESAGYKNAMAVKIQPDDADWDAGDIRYNVLRWTSSPVAPFGGYGPSFANPRTGQLLGADIMLEYVHFTNRVTYTKLFEGTFHDYQIPEKEQMAEELLKELLGDKNVHYCNYGDFLQHNIMFGEALLRANGENELEMKGMKQEAMLELIMHEVGHTLGLNHNMKASQLYAPSELHDKTKTVQTGLTGSVMDYVAININRDRANQGHYYSVNVGPYDKWAIEYGYKPGLTQEELDAIAARSYEPQLAFGNDADDMRSPGRGIDPRVMIGDLSNDVVAYSIERMELVNDLLPTLRKKYEEEGTMYQELRVAFNVLAGQYGNAANVTSRYIGGVYLERVAQDQENAKTPFTPVPAEYQQKAMDALAKYLFAPNAFDVPEELYRYLQLQRRGYNFFSGTEDPKVHNTLLRMQQRVLGALLHPTTLHRIVDTEVYGNEYTLDKMMGDLTDAIFKEDRYGDVNSFRQNLQLEYTNALIGAVGGKNSDRYPYQARSMALYSLRKIEDIAKSTSGNTATKAHRAHLKQLIDQTLNR